MAFALNLSMSQSEEILPTRRMMQADDPATSPQLPLLVKEAEQVFV